MSAQMQNGATANEVSYTRETLSVEVAVGETKFLLANFLKISVEHKPFSSDEAPYFEVSGDGICY